LVIIQNAERDGEDQVSEDQPEVGVDETDGPKGEKEGHHHRGRRDHLAGEHAVGRKLLPRKRKRAKPCPLTTARTSASEVAPAAITREFTK
jgi:hypothetical protein